jgi:hypothetical protein
MSSIAVSSMVFAVVFAGALLGMFLRAVLPEHHLTAASQDVMKLGLALVSTMAALVLGLLIASAKSSYDAQNTSMVESSAKVVLLDRVLAHYGPETKEARDLIRDFVVRFLDQTWPKNGANRSSLQAPYGGAEIILDKIQQLSPKDENQQSLRTQALGITWDIYQTRWLQYAQQTSSISMSLLLTLVFWLTAIFVSFGLFAPRNASVVVSIFIAAVSVSGAILMILEMFKPYGGFVQLSSGPVSAALSQLGR